MQAMDGKQGNAKQERFKEIQERGRQDKGEASKVRNRNGRQGKAKQRRGR